MLYQEKPNIVKIVMTDPSGTAERFAPGVTLDEVIRQVEKCLGHAEDTPVKKPRRKRRTKMEMAQAPNPQPDTGLPPNGESAPEVQAKPEPRKKLKKVWPEGE